MATYKGIQGYAVQVFSADPTASAGTEGQLFYNSTDEEFRIVVDDSGYTVKTVTTS